MEQQLNLESLQSPLERTVAGYGQFFRNLLGLNLEFAPQSKFELTPAKGYTAKVEVPCFYDGEPAGKLVAIVLTPGQGTGDDSLYRAGELSLPIRMNNYLNPSHILPRSKKDVYAEMMLPLFSQTPDRVAQYAVCLERIDVVNGQVMPTHMGEPLSTYQGLLAGRGQATPMPYFTTGIDQRKRFGDPHAIGYNPGFPTAVQVAGFLTVHNNQPRNGLRDLMDILQR